MHTFHGYRLLPINFNVVFHSYKEGFKKSIFQPVETTLRIVLFSFFELKTSNFGYLPWSSPPVSTFFPISEFSYLIINFLN